MPNRYESTALKGVYFSSTVSANRFVKVKDLIPADGIMSVEACGSASRPLGVSLATQTASNVDEIILSGRGAIVEIELATTTVVAGDILMPVASGKGKKLIVTTITDPVWESAIAEEDGTTGNIISCRLIEPIRRADKN